tara:strand:+ start:348 stop:1223 length:876 start_codon:yes stop_codon:yes gene_type:complete
LNAQTRNIASEFVEIQKDTLGKKYHYYISKYTVSVKDYQDYLKFLGLRLPEAPDYGWDDNTLPMVLVSYKDALSYTYWMTDFFQIQFRLPTETEWVLASDTRQKKMSIPKDKPICVNCSKPNSNGIYGVNGNVWEWTSTLKDKEYNIIKGGSYSDELDESLKENPAALSPELKILDVGFRLVVDVKEMKKYKFAFKVEKLLQTLFPEYTNIGVEPHTLYLNDGQISWKQKEDIVSIDYKELKLKLCCVEYETDSNSDLNPKTLEFYFAKDDIKLVEELKLLINNRDLSIFE